MERFKLGFIYERHSRHESGSTSPLLPSDLDPMPNPDLLTPPFVGLLVLLDPLIGMVSSLISLLLLLYPLFPFHLVTNKQ
jgi:hypothetical protein